MDEKELLHVLTELKDYEEASAALLELRYKNPLAAEDHCKQVLENKLGDIYYRGMVIDILYSLNRNFTLEFILANLDRLPDYILATALSNVIEDESLVPGSGELQEFISKMSEYITKNSFSNEPEPVFLKFIFTFKQPVMLTFDRIIVAGKNGWINEALSLQSLVDLFGEPEIFTPAYKSYPTMLVYNDLEFRLRNNKPEVMTIRFSQQGALVPAPIALDQFQTPESRHFSAIEALLKQQQVQWEKDEIMSDADQEVYITEHGVHLAFHEGILTKVGVVYT